MPRVSKESLERLSAFIDSLPPETRNKCALCNETLVHLVKTAEVESGAGTATVTRTLADRINKDATPGDRVSDGALMQRVRRADGSIMTDRQNNPQPENDQPVRKEDEPEPIKSEVAMKYARMAVMDLKCIEDDHPDRNEAFEYVLEWVKNHY
jgi:hypothetical protein